VSLVVLKLIIEVILFNESKLDQIWFNYLMLLVKSTDLVLFFVVVLYTCEMVPTHLRALAVYSLVVLELGFNLLGLEL